MAEELRPQHCSDDHSRTMLPEIYWVSTRPDHWRLAAGALGWGLAHNRWYRQNRLSHLDWFPVTWADHAAWRAWCRVDGRQLFADPGLVAILPPWPTVHAIGPPGAGIVLREALAIEERLGC